ncbi:MAG TPA: ABC transporter permease [Verrucomicrobiota bacterium]|nr:ABC transporter permease [Verrucomicrobiota bacterium]
MATTYEIYRHPEKGLAAAPVTFSIWPYLFAEWWALFNRLWMPAIVAAVLGAGLGFIVRLYSMGVIPFWALCLFILAYPTRLYLAFRGGYWKARQLERNGYSYLGEVTAHTGSAAIAKARAGKLRERARPGGIAFRLPRGLTRVFAVAGLTWKAAFRFKLFLVIAVLLLGAVIGLPVLIKDDGTARGFTQILLTYTLSTITGLLGLSTLWLSCGTLARDIEECQVQMLAVKPIARWQIWLGKWLGIVSLNAVLLALSGASVYTLLQWRATRLPAAEQGILRKEVLVARGSAREPDFSHELREKAEELLRQRLRETPVQSDAERAEVRRQILEQVKASVQVVPPGYSRVWQVDLGLVRYLVRDRPLQLRVKFNAARESASGTFDALFQVGVPQETQLWRTETPMSLAPDTYHEFEIPPNLFDENGVLTIMFVNPNDTALLFPLEDGLEVLYPEGTFGLNFIRGLGIIWCWMALLSALGLAAATFLSFPVAAFFSLAMLTVAFSSGTMTTAIEEGTIMGSDSETGEVGSSIVDSVAIPVFRGILAVVNLARQFSPIDALSAGRSIGWGQLAVAFGQIVVVLGGFFALGGIAIFQRRELATAQGTQ